MQKIEGSLNEMLNIFGKKIFMHAHTSGPKTNRKWGEQKQERESVLCVVMEASICQVIKPDTQKRTGKTSQQQKRELEKKFKRQITKF